MVFNATFNNISNISWQSVLLVEETGVPGEITDLLQVTATKPSSSGEGCLIPLVVLLSWI
jgi:hypothetical protein